VEGEGDGRLDAEARGGIAGELLKSTAALNLGHTKMRVFDSFRQEHAFFVKIRRCERGEN
jgi:hypothetical protein